MKNRVVIIGSGVGGLVAAADLARRGMDVTVLERAPASGGKMRHVMVDGSGIDGGPTVFTMRWIFEGLFRDCGTSLQAELELTPAETLARHAWCQGGRLDLFADIDRSADAIGDFAGPKDAQGYRDFCQRSRGIYRSLRDIFIASEKPSNPVYLAMRAGLSGIGGLIGAAPMKTMYAALSDYFEDPRLRQLFGRYATYVGSSPWLAPATLMLVAHVEQDGVWLVKGGMRRVAEVLQTLAERQGATFRFGAHVSEIERRAGRAAAVRLEGGERIEADAILFNGDCAALASGALGKDVVGAVPKVEQRNRSLSAITLCMKAKTSGFPLVHHNVFFADDYAREFRQIFEHRDIVAQPTVYICAQDRGEGAPPNAAGEERLLLLINAPPDGDTRAFTADDVERYAARAFAVVETCGLEIERVPGNAVPTSPAGFNKLFPATGGALYGLASHGSQATFRRPGTTTRIPGLYLAGGSVHPGAGVPMAAMSGRLAAARIAEDFVAKSAARRSRRSLRIRVPD